MLTLNEHVIPLLFQESVASGTFVFVLCFGLLQICLVFLDYALLHPTLVDSTLDLKHMHSLFDRMFYFGSTSCPTVLFKFCPQDFTHNIKVSNFVNPYSGLKCVKMKTYNLKTDKDLQLEN